MKLDFTSAALIIVDAQNDFFPGGALEVKDGESILEPLNILARLFARNNGKVIATQDWHPANHASFAVSHHEKNPFDTINLGEVKNQVLWPEHCVQGSAGADFHKELDTNPINFIIRKGFRENLDSYSTFFENDRKTITGLDGLLKSLSIKTLVMGGLATDYCVFYSAIDAAGLGYHTIVAGDAVCGIDFPAGSVKQAVKIMSEAGVIFTPSGNLQ